MRFSILFSFVLIYLTSCANQATTQQQSSKPNVILIMVDDLGWKDLGFMGSTYYETPNLDAFAKEGMVFTNAYASAANCAPSRASMLTGKQSPRHGVYTVSPSARGDNKTRKLVPIKNTKHIENDVFTLPDMFKAEGYVTGSFGKWHVGDDPTLQGIDVNVGGNGRGNPGREGYFSPYQIGNISDGPEGEYLTDRLTNEAIDFVSNNKENPFFLYLPFYTVHTPLMAKEHVIEKFVKKNGTDGQNNATYAAMVYSMDENIGRLLNYLEESGLEENTLVIFTSDNGGIRAISRQEPLRAGKGSYYEGGIKVPMAVRWPGQVKAESICKTRVTNLDFFPMLQSIVGSNEKAELLDGNDITPLLLGKSIAERDLFWHFPIYLQAYSKVEDDGRDPLFRTRPGTVMISGDWKLHEYYEDGALELYDLSKDPGERNNLVSQEKVLTEELHSKMKSWRIALGAPVPMKLNPEYDVEFEKELMNQVRKEE